MMISFHHCFLAWLLLDFQAPILVSTEPVPANELAMEINVIRREYAKKYNVPNMHELVWSDELAALPINWTTQFIDYDAFAYTMVTTSAQSDLRTHIMMGINQYQSYNKAYQEKYAKTPYMDKLIELLYPLQSFIACSSSEFYHENVRSQGKVCMVGPHKEYRRMFDVSGESKEVPGSKCQPKFRNDNGLCVAEEPSKMSYFHGDPQEFLDDVSSVRRQYAKEYNVANMHQLVWNESLTDIANSLDWMAKWPQARITWRYFTLIYPGITETLTEAVEQFLKKTPEERDQYIEEKTSSVPFLEILNPLQMQIGCAYKEYPGTKIFNLCLLGNSGKFELWDFDVKPTIEPGSNCSMGYVNDDGLCSIPTTTIAPPKTQPARRVPEKQTSDEKEKDSEGSEDVADSGTSIFVHLVMFFSILRFF